MSITREDAATAAGPRCSVLARESGEPLTATAPVAQAWLVIEQPGAWGRAALLDSRLPAGVGERLVARSEGSGTTVLLARRPGRSTDEGTAGPARRFWIAHTAPGGVRMRSGTVDDVAVLADIDLRAVARGELPPLGTRSTAPLLLVCGNAKRDACCALFGRALAASAAAEIGDDVVWESSHLGGHRFAPTSLLLPWGVVHGALDHAGAVDLVARAREGRLRLEGYRGRTALRRWLQAAETAVREAEDVDGIDVLDVLRVTPFGRPAPAPVGTPAAEPTAPVEAEVRHADGRAWRVVVERVELAERPESCGKGPVPGHVWVAGQPRPAPSWR